MKPIILSGAAILINVALITNSYPSSANSIQVTKESPIVTNQDAAQPLQTPSTSIVPDVPAPAPDLEQTLVPDEPTSPAEDYSKPVMVNDSSGNPVGQIQVTN